MMGRSHADGSLGTRAMLVLVAGVVTYLTLQSFIVRAPESLQAIVDAAFSYDRETLQHIVPAAVIVLLVRAGWGLDPRRAALLSFAGLFSLEIVQLFIEFRHARLGDVLAQVVGLAIGGRIPIRPIGRRMWRVVWVTLLVAWLGMLAAIGVRGQFGHTLGPMDPTFRLVVGDEYDGGRPWLGTVHAFAVATDGTDRVAFGPPPSDEPWIGAGTIPIDLQRAHGAWSSVDAVPSLNDALDAAASIEVRLEVTPDASIQDGPARIVTVSKGMSYRNLTIGQQDDALVVRIRTPRSGRNASSPQYVFSGVFVAGERRSLRVRTDGGSTSLWVDGSRRSEQFAYITPRDWLGLRRGPADAISVIAAFAPIGLAAGMVWALDRGPRRQWNGRRMWIAAAALPIAPLGLIWGVAAVLDRPVAWWLVASAVALSLAGAGVALLLKDRR